MSPTLELDFATVNWTVTDDYVSFYATSPTGERYTRTWDRYDAKVDRGDHPLKCLSDLVIDGTYCEDESPLQMWATILGREYAGGDQVGDARWWRIRRGDQTWLVDRAQAVQSLRETVEEDPSRVYPVWQLDDLPPTSRAPGLWDLCVQSTTDPVRADLYCDPDPQTWSLFLAAAYARQQGDLVLWQRLVGRIVWNDYLSLRRRHGVWCLVSEDGVTQYRLSEALLLRLLDEGCRGAMTRLTEGQ